MRVLLRPPESTTRCGRWKAVADWPLIGEGKHVWFHDRLPAGLILGTLVGVLIPFKSSRALFMVSIAVGALAALFAAWESRVFLSSDISVGEFLLQGTLPVAAICFVLGLIGTYLGRAVRQLFLWLLRLIAETARLG